MSIVYTIGHSTRPLPEFIAVLQSFQIQTLCDIRTVPKSRRNPQFSRDVLEQELPKHGIAYTHVKALGGLRCPRMDSPNSGWRNESFRGYADHMQTQEFLSAIDDLVRRGEQNRVAIMCAEAVPWRCHRSLVADALLVRGIEVEDIMAENRAQLHKLTAWAEVNGINITYPARNLPLDL